MTRFTTFTDKELNDMEYVFCGVQSLTHLMDEICAERECREKAKEIMNSNYGVATRSCDDDEKLVVLCMINKQLKDMNDILVRIDEKI